MTLVLGEGAAAGAGIGPKGALLDRARAAGLPVPAGIIVPDGAAVDLPHDVEGPLAVRSAFSIEDGRGRSHAGRFHTELFESDIARPRFAECPDPILQAVAGRAATRASPPRRDLATTVTTPVWLAARWPMAARERLRSRAMRAFAAIRARLLALAAAAAADGRLPAADDVWLLTADEVVTLDHDAVFDAAAIARRRADRADLAARRLPDTLHRFDDLDAVGGAAGGRQVVAGVPLAPGVVVGRALRVTEPPAVLPAAFDGDATVLVARSVDAGWVSIFRQVAGVAVEVGGDLSHGSIILREVGVPSVTNLGELGTSPETGDRVELDADRGRLRVLDG